MTTALVLYGSNAANATLTTACNMATTTGGTETSVTSTASGTNDYQEIYSQGGSPASVSSIPSTPTGHGWLFKPGAVTFVAGNWSASITLACSSGTGATVTLRVFKYSGGSYTSIGSLSSITISGHPKTTYSVAATSLGSFSLLASDYVYIDLWWYDSGGANSNNPVVYVSTTSSNGVASDMQITTPGYNVNATTATKSLVVRSIVATKKVISTAIRASVATQKTTSSAIRNVIRTAKTAYSQIRVRIGPPANAYNSYKKTVLADGPTAYYRLDESSGTVANDSSGNGYNAQLSGSVTLSQSSLIVGDSDASILFNGVTGMISLPYNLNPSTWSAITLEYWIKITSGAHHVAITADSTSTTLYIDGTVYTSGGSGDEVIFDQGIYYAGSFSNGTLDEIALYNKKLTLAQIATHYYAGMSVTRSAQVRTVVATKNFKTLVVRALIRSINTQTAVLRVHTSVPGTTATVIAKLRALVRTLVTKTTAIRIVARGRTVLSQLRAVVRTLATKSSTVRIPVGTKNTKISTIRTITSTKFTRSIAIRSVLATKRVIVAVMRAIISTKIARSLSVRARISSTHTATLALRVAARSITLLVRLRAAVQTKNTKASSLRSIVRTINAVSAKLRAVIATKRVFTYPIRTSVRTLTTRSMALRVITTATGTIKNASITLRTVIRSLITRSVKIRLAVHTAKSSLLNLRAVVKGITLVARIKMLVRSQVSKLVSVRMSIYTQATKLSTIRALIRTANTSTARVRIVSRSLVTKITSIRIVARGINKSLPTRVFVRSMVSKAVSLRAILCSKANAVTKIRIRSKTLASKTSPVRTTIYTSSFLLVVLRAIVVNGGRLSVVLRSRICTTRASIIPLRVVVPGSQVSSSNCLLTLCIPAQLSNFSFAMDGVALDPPAMTTGPLLQGGGVYAGQRFVLIWNSPSAATQNALSQPGTMTFAAHDGSPITTGVVVASTTSGNSLIADIVITSQASTDKRVIKTQFY
jgi:Concanavalin A-like lectin/glucanases superfamily